MMLNHDPKTTNALVFNHLPTPEQMTYYDLRNATFDQFVQYVFDDAHADLKEGGDYASVDFDSSEFAKLYTKLFSHPTFLLDRFNLKQLESGFWEIQSCNLPGNASEIIFDSQVPFELRQLCIESMYSLYEKLFAIPSLPKVCDMWWDGIAYGYCCGNYSRENQDQRQIQDVMFSTLCRILALSSEACQFLKAHKSFEGKDYARACIAGNIM